MAAILAAVATAATAAFTVGSVTSAVVTAAISAGIGFITSAIVGGPKGSTSAATGSTATPDFASPLSQSIDPTGPLHGIMGRRRVGGAVVFTGKTDTHDYVVYHIAGDRVDAIEAVYLDNVRAQIDSVDRVSNAAYTVNGRRVLSIQLYDGTQTAANSWLNQAFGSWTSRHIGLSTAYAVVRIENSSDVAEKISALPDITFLVRGHLCYDPRDASQRVTNKDTWKYSANPIIQMANFIISPIGGNASHTRINWDSVKAAAAICDRRVDTISGVSEPLYACHSYWTTDMRNEEVLIEMGATCAGGTWPGANGFEFWAGHYTPPTETITEPMYASGGLTWSERNPSGDPVNAVMGRFVSTHDNYEMRDYPAYIDRRAVNAMGGAIITSPVDFQFVTSPRQAQYLAKITLHTLTHGTPATLHCQITALDTTAGDMIAITDEFADFVARPYRVLKDALNMEDMTLHFDLRHESREMYDWDYKTEEQPYYTASSTPVANSSKVPPPPELTVSWTYTTVVGGLGLKMPSWTFKMTAKSRAAPASKFEFINATKAGKGGNFAVPSIDADGVITTPVISVAFGSTIGPITIKVRAVNGTAKSDWTIVTFTPGAASGTVVVPEAPPAPKVTQTATAATITYAPSPTAGCTKLVLRRRLLPGDAWETIDVNTNKSTVFVDQTAGLSEKNYEYAATAVRPLSPAAGGLSSVNSSASDATITS